MLRVPPLVVTATSSVPADAARRAESMMAPVTVSELFGLITISFTVPIVAQFDGICVLGCLDRRLSASHGPAQPRVASNRAAGISDALVETLAHDGSSRPGLRSRPAWPVAAWRPFPSCAM